MAEPRFVELKAWGKQKEWLTQGLLHRAPSAYLCQVNGVTGAQLEHPGGGPLGWVRCPYKKVNAVVRIAGKWYWQVFE